MSAMNNELTSLSEELAQTKDLLRASEIQVQELRATLEQMKMQLKQKVNFLQQLQIGYCTCICLYIARQ